ncbi:MULTISPECIES: hypothetical protein [unclassified Gilliamella]|uniref:hypothetical protein n=1 Tax=unclassified Gilliamella TaxID=2685620 RepID=UPI000A359370|nr:MULTISPECIES: hypothetical protein [unclassified Gilliamella]OTQ74741.1 hypothetical protein B6C99_03010 [Gilliamella sp. N-G2]OTQ79439.1 hypothetical protein B6D23_05245 [Gilliamella sp. N-W3]
MTQPTLEQFLDDVKNHELTIHQNNGVDRHLIFKNPNDCSQHFNITTFSNYLVITGDMGALVFSRLHDMFEFFRSDDLKINPDYWAEKIQSASYEGKIESYSEFDIDEVKRCAKEDLDDFIKGNWLSEEEEYNLREDLQRILRAEDEYEIVEAIRNFDCNDFDFTDFWEVDHRKYRYRYIWICYAIVWGIKKFDELNKE